jgi:hypothetical protein
MQDLIKLAIDSMLDKSEEGPRVILCAKSLEAFAASVIAAHTAKCLGDVEPVAWRITDGEGGYTYHENEPDQLNKDWTAKYGRKFEPMLTTDQAAAMVASAIAERDARIAELEQKLAFYKTPLHFGG